MNDDDSVIGLMNAQPAHAVLSSYTDERDTMQATSEGQIFSLIFGGVVSTRREWTHLDAVPERPYGCLALTASVSSLSDLTDIYGLVARL